MTLSDKERIKKDLEAKRPFASIMENYESEILKSVKADIRKILKEENYMLTKTFIEQVEQLAFVKKAYKHSKSIQIVDEHGDNIMYVRTDKYYGVDARSIAFDRLTDYEQDQLMHLVWQYISTPVDEREPEERFRMKVKKKLGLGLALVDQYLNYDRKNDDIGFEDGEQTYDVQTIFTDSELKDLFTPAQLDWIEMTFDKEWAFDEEWVE